MIRKLRPPERSIGASCLGKTRWGSEESAVLPQSVRVDGPCCHPVSSCRYSQARIAGLLRTINEATAAGLTPLEAVAAHFAGGGRDHVPFGPREPKAAEVHADLVRAMRAGHRDPMSIASFLCEFGVGCEDD